MMDTLRIILLFFTSITSPIPVYTGVEFAENIPYSELRSYFDRPVIDYVSMRSQNGTGLIEDFTDSIEQKEMDYWQAHVFAVASFRNGEVAPQAGCWDRGDCPALTIKSIAGYNLPPALVARGTVVEGGSYWTTIKKVLQVFLRRWLYP